MKQQLNEKEFFAQLEGKGYSQVYMSNPYLDTMRSDRMWIVDKKTKQTIGHYRDSHYNGRGDFTIYETPLEERAKLKPKKPAQTYGFNGVGYKSNPLSLETIEEYLKNIFGETDKRTLQ